MEVHSGKHEISETIGIVNINSVWKFKVQNKLQCNTNTILLLHSILVNAFLSKWENCGVEICFVYCAHIIKIASKQIISKNCQNLKILYICNVLVIKNLEII